MHDMHDNTLLRISILASITGIALLLILDHVTTVKQSPISSLNKEMLDKYVKVKAKITKIYQSEKVYILTLNDNTGEIKAVIFKNSNSHLNSNTNDNYDLQKNQLIEAEGKLAEYKNQLEIIIDEIRLL